jgi:hypothetical protein
LSRTTGWYVSQHRAYVPHVVEIRRHEAELSQKDKNRLVEASSADNAAAVIAGTVVSIVVVPVHHPLAPFAEHFGQISGFLDGNRG